MPFNLRWAEKGLGNYVRTTGMYAALGFASLTITALADVHSLYFENVPVRSKWTAVDESIQQYTTVRKNYITNQIAQTYFDAASNDTLIQTVKKLYQTNDFIHL